MKPNPKVLPLAGLAASREQPEWHARLFDLSQIAKVAGIAISLAVSPVTAISDPWLAERRRRDAVVTMSIYQEVLGRFISRAEALRIAREILDRAERERLDIAEYEAARGVQYKEQTKTEENENGTER